MHSSERKISDKMKLVAFLTIGLASLVFSLATAPSNTLFIDGNRVESSRFGMSFYDNSGAILFSLSPLNDYYYDGSYKEHLQYKLTESNNGNILNKFFLTTRSITEGRHILLWNTKGVNEKGNSFVNYTITQLPESVEIKRDIRLSNTVFDRIGKTITFCNDCIVTDDKKRAYFNSETVQPWDIITLASFGYAPIVIRENQIFPADIKTIKIIARSGKVKLEIDINGNSVLLQNRWRLLEFISRMEGNKKSVAVQKIKIHY